MKRENLDELSKKILEVNVANDWHSVKYSDKHYLSLICSEIYEFMQADREGARASIESYKFNFKCHGVSDDVKHLFTDEIKAWFIANIKSTIEDELADIIIRSLDLIALRDLQVEEQYNAIKDYRKEYLNYEYPKRVDVPSFVIELNKIAIEPISFANSTELLPNSLSTLIASVVWFAEVENIDIWQHVNLKMEYNKLRGIKHGGKKY